MSHSFICAYSKIREPPLSFLGSVAVTETCDFLLVLYVPCSVACFADELSATKAFDAFGLNDTATVTDIALDHAFLGCDFSFSFALVTVDGDQTSPFAFATSDFACPLTRSAFQKRKHHLTELVSRLPCLHTQYFLNLTSAFPQARAK